MFKNLVGWLQGLARSAANVVTKVQDAVTETVSGVLNWVGDLVGGARDAAEDLTEALTKARAEAREWVNDFTQLVKNAVTEAQNNMTGVRESVQEWIGSMAEDAAGKIAAVQKNLAQAADEARTWVEGLTQSANDTMAEVLKSLTEAGSDARELVESLIQNVVEGDGNLLERLAQAGGDLQGQIGELVESAQARIKEIQANLDLARTDVENRVTELVQAAGEKIAEIRENLTNARAEAATRLQALTSEAEGRITEIQADLAKASAEVRNWLENVVQSTTGTAAEVQAALTEARARAESRLAELSGEANNKIAEVRESLADVRSEIETNLVDLARAAQEMIAEVQENLTEARTNAASWLESLVQTAKGLMEDVRENLAEAISQGREWIEGIIGNAAETAETLLNEARAEAREWAENFVDSAKNTITEVQNDMTQIRGSIQEWISSLAEAASETASDMQETLTEAASEARTWLEDLSQSAGNSVASILENLSTAFDIQGFLDTLTQDFEGDNILEILSQAREALEGRAGELIEAAKGNIAEIQENLAGARAEAEELIAGLVQAAGVKIAEVQGDLTEAKTDAAARLEALAGEAEEKIAEIQAGLAAASAEVQNWLAGVIQSTTGTAAEVQAALAEARTEAEDRLAALSQEARDKIAEVQENLTETRTEIQANLSGLAGAARAMIAEVQENLAEARTNAAGWFEDLARAASDMVENIRENLAEAVSSGREWIEGILGNSEGGDDTSLEQARAEAEAWVESFIQSKENAIAKVEGDMELIMDKDHDWAMFLVDLVSDKATEIMGNQDQTVSEIWSWLEDLIMGPASETMGTITEDLSDSWKDTRKLLDTLIEDAGNANADTLQLLSQVSQTLGEQMDEAVQSAAPGLQEAKEAFFDARFEFEILADDLVQIAKDRIDEVQSKLATSQVTASERIAGLFWETYYKISSIKTGLDQVAMDVQDWLLFNVLDNETATTEEIRAGLAEMKIEAVDRLTALIQEASAHVSEVDDIFAAGRNEIQESIADHSRTAEGMIAEILEKLEEARGDADDQLGELARTAQSIFAEVEKDLENIVTAGREWIDDIVENTSEESMEDLAKVQAEAAAWVESFFQSAENAATEAKDNMAQAKWDVQGWEHSLLTNILNRASELIDGINAAQDEALGLSDDFTRLTEDAITSIQNDLSESKANTQNLLDALIQGVEGNDPDLLESLSQIRETLEEQVNGTMNLAGKKVDAVEDLLAIAGTEIQDRMENFFNEVWSKYEELRPDFDTVQNEAIERIAVLVIEVEKTIAEIQENLQEAYLDAEKWLVEEIQSTTGTADEVRAALTEAKTLAETRLASLVQAAEEKIAEIHEALTTAYSEIQKQMDAISERGEELVKEVQENLDTAKSEIDAWIEENMGVAGTIVTEARESLENIVSEGRDLVSDIIGNTPDDPPNPARDAVEEFLNALKDDLSLETLTKWGTELVNKVSEQLSSGAIPLPSWVKDMADNILAELNLDGPPSAAWIENLVAALSEKMGDSVETGREWVKDIIDSLLEDYDLVHSSDIQVAHVDETKTGTTAKTIGLEAFGEEYTALSWNLPLTALSVKTLAIAGTTGDLAVAMEESGKVLVVVDENGAEVMRLTLLAPGENGNESDGWAVTFEQFQGLAHSVGGAANEALLLSLFADGTNNDGTTSPNILTLAITDDAPKVQFSSNLVILDTLGKNLLDAVSEKTGGSLYDFLHTAVFDENHNIDFTLDTMLQDLATAAQNTFSDVLNTENTEGILDLVSLFVDKDLGGSLKTFINSPVASFVLGSRKAGILEMVENYLNFTDTARSVEGSGPITGELNVDFGFDGAANDNTDSLSSWQPLHGDAVPAAAGWSVSGVQAVFDLMKIRAAAYNDMRLTVSAAADENVYPPQTLEVYAGEAKVMTLAMTFENGAYGYTIEQHTGLSHDQDSVINTVLGLVQNAAGDDINATLEEMVTGLVDSLIADNIDSSLLSFVNSYITDIKYELVEALTIENIIETLSTGNLLYLPLPYVTMDADGDLTSSLLLQLVKDSVPTVAAPVETLLSSDLHGSFSIEAFDGIGAISVNDMTIWQDGQSTNNALSPYGDLVITDVNSTDDGIYTINYTYVRTTGEVGNGTDHYIFTVADGDGDTIEVGLDITLDTPLYAPAMAFSTLSAAESSETEATVQPEVSYETVLSSHDFRTPTTDTSEFTGTLLSEVTAFKGKGWSNSRAEEGLNSSSMKAWMASNTAKVSKSAAGFGVAGNAGGLIASDGDKIGYNNFLLFTVTEAVLMTLAAQANQISIAFGDMGSGEKGAVFFYDAGGDYLGSKTFGGANTSVDNFSSVSVAENEFAESIASFLVVPGSGSFTITSLTVPEEKEVRIESSDQDSGRNALADGSAMAGSLDKPAANDLDADEIRALVTGSEEGGILYGGENDALILGGDGDDLIYAGGGDNEIWGNGGADIFVMENGNFDGGLDKIMDFNFEEGDRLDLTALVDIVLADLSLENDVLSFSIESDAGERKVEVHLNNAPNLEAITADYTAANLAEQEELLTSLIKNLSLV